MNIANDPRNSWIVKSSETKSETRKFLGKTFFENTTSSSSTTAGKAEGIAAARRRGVVFGRPKITVPESFIESEKLYKSGKLPVTEAARLCGMCRSTFWAKVSR